MKNKQLILPQSKNMKDKQIILLQNENTKDKQIILLQSEDTQYQSFIHGSIRYDIAEKCGIDINNTDNLDEATINDYLSRENAAERAELEELLNNYQSLVVWVCDDGSHGEIESKNLLQQLLQDNPIDFEVIYNQTQGYLSIGVYYNDSYKHYYVYAAC